MTNLEKYSDQAVFIGRLFFSSMFLLFAYDKMTAYAGTVSYMSSLGLPAPALFTLLAIIIELGGAACRFWERRSVDRLRRVSGTDRIADRTG